MSKITSYIVVDDGEVIAKKAKLKEARAVFKAIKLLKKSKQEEFQLDIIKETITRKKLTEGTRHNKIVKVSIEENFSF